MSKFQGKFILAAGILLELAGIVHRDQPFFECLLMAAGAALLGVGVNVLLSIKDDLK